jgi:hypothetical protein
MESSALQEPAAEQRRLAELSRYAITLDESDPKLDLITELAIKSVGA